MLTRSPVPARSPSASPSSFHATRTHNHHNHPHGFHYAPAFPQKRSPKPPTVLSRRQSSSTSSPLGVNKAPSQPQPQPQPQSQYPPSTRPPTYADRPATYVAVDAATQYSPMEPYDYFAPRNVRPKSSPVPHAQPSAVTTESQPAPPRAVILTSQTTTIDADPQASAATTAAAPTSTPTPVEEPPMLKAPHPLSPNKRRNSQGPGSIIEDGSSSSAAGQAVPKRVKPDAAPPKVLPVRYELCAIEDVVVLIANMLAELIETNDALAMRSGHLTRFHSRTAPGISVLDYLHRLAKHATLTPPLLLSMVYYIDRLCALYPDFTINTLTVHRFLITAATVAAKGLSDSFWNNSTYARVGGVKVAELKLLELEFLHRVDWKIVPDPDVLVAYFRGLVQRSPAYVLEDEVEGDEMVDEDEETEISDDAAEEDESGSEASAREKPPDVQAEA